MKKSRLILFAIFILIVLIAIITFIRKNDKPNNPNMMTQSSEFEKNTEKLIDFDENVMRYGNNVYLLDEKRNLLLKYDPENSLTTIVHNFRNTNYCKRFFIRNNMLLFSYNNATYYSDLDGNGLSKMCNGEIVYINDDIYLYIIHNDSKDELYIASYDNKTFKTTMDIAKNLARGTSIEYLKSSDEDVFFTSSNSENEISLFEVDIKNSKVAVINKRSSNAPVEGHKLEYSNVIKTDDIYYYIIDEIAETTNEDVYVSSSLYGASRDYYFSELFADKVGKYLSYNKNNKNEVLYQKYNEKAESYVWRTTSSLGDINTNWKNFLYGDVTTLFNIKGNSIYETGYEFVNINEDLSGYKIYKVVRLKNGFYFMLVNDNSSEWYFCKDNGKNLIKIY